MNGFNLVSREKSPCKNCTERHEACWGKCEKYKAWKSRLDELNGARKAYGNIPRPNVDGCW